MESTASPHAPRKALTAGVAEAWSVCTVTLESKARHPASFLRSVSGEEATGPGRGGACRGKAGRPGTGLSDYKWGHRALVVTRGSPCAPLRPWSSSWWLSWKRRRELGVSPKLPFLTATPDRGRSFSGHALGTPPEHHSCAFGGSALHAPSAQPLYPLRGMGFFPRETIARDPRAP